MWIRSVFLEVSHVLIPRGRDPTIPKILGVSYMHMHSMRNNNQILRGNQTRCEEVYRVDHKY